MNNADMNIVKVLRHGKNSVCNVDGGTFELLSKLNKITIGCSKHNGTEHFIYSIA